ncbi:sigma factor AlgU regulatory protein MucB precursor [mine drainage metagenome]|uniref:Sigma factor AlgU regulatory protein MucB n=1 Tax=mine drainage metagenome TaxID=410659 RepID=A0A1J5TLM5_9ZZZZ
MMQPYKYLFVVLLQMGVEAAFADPMQVDEADWLKTMAFAAHQTNYSGVFVYQSGGRVEMSRITHVADAAGEHERLEGVDGGKRELIRDNDQVWLYTEGHKVRLAKNQIKRAFPALLPEQTAILKENYSITPAEEDEVAGYHAHAVVFLPRDNLRYARKMWADSNSGLLLKAVVLNDRGYVIEQYSFMQLTVGNNIDRKWIVPDKSSASEVAQELHLSPLPKVELLDEPCGWQVDALPPGFKKILEMRRPFRGNKEHVIQMVFSDGLAGISVFIEKAPEAGNVHSGLSGQGAAHVYNRMVGDSLITVVGEVPSRTVIQVGDSVRYAGE